MQESPFTGFFVGVVVGWLSSFVAFILALIFIIRISKIESPDDPLSKVFGLPGRKLNKPIIADAQQEHRRTQGG